MYVNKKSTEGMFIDLKMNHRMRQQKSLDTSGVLNRFVPQQDQTPFKVKLFVPNFPQNMLIRPKLWDTRSQKVNFHWKIAMHINANSKYYSE